jgi:hypothetical protein
MAYSKSRVSVDIVSQTWNIPSSIPSVGVCGLPEAVPSYEGDLLLEMASGNYIRATSSH